MNVAWTRGIVILLVASASAARAADDKSPPQPNIVFILADDKY